MITPVIDYFLLIEIFIIKIFLQFKYAQPEFVSKINPEKADISR